MWKQKLGSSGTYHKLIEVFERAGYESYADSVRRTVHDNEIDYEINNDEYSRLMLPQTNTDPLFPPLSQPLTYPALIPLNSSPQLTPHQPSPEEHYVLINSAIAEKLPEGEQILYNGTRRWVNFCRYKLAHYDRSLWLFIGPMCHFNYTLSWDIYTQVVRFIIKMCWTLIV